MCVYWAQQCRRILFHEGAIDISSYKQAAEFRRIIVTAGSTRLTPIINLIATVDVAYSIHPDLPSWHHILGYLVPLIPPNKFGSLAILGPSSTPLRSPHWGVPRSLPAFITPYREFWLSDMHFPSLYILLSLLRQLPRLEDLNLSNLTWDTETVVPAPTKPRKSSRREYPVLCKIYLLGCEHSALLFSHVMQLGPNAGSLLRTLSDEDKEAIVETVNGVCAAHLTILKAARPQILYNATPCGEYTPSLQRVIVV